MRNFLATFCDDCSSLFTEQSPNLCIRVFTLLSDPLFHRLPSSIDHSFSLSDHRKLILSTFHVSDATRKMIAIAPYLNGLPRSIDHDCKKLGEFVVVDVVVGERDCIFEDVLEVDIAGGREVELIGVCELHVLGLITCVGCDIVQADHAPDGGVAQGIFHGILVRHHGKNQEEVEEELGQEVKRQEEEDTQEQVRMPMTMDGSD